LPFAPIVPMARWLVVQAVLHCATQASRTWHSLCTLPLSASLLVLVALVLVALVLVALVLVALWSDAPVLVLVLLACLLPVCSPAPRWCRHCADVSLCLVCGPHRPCSLHNPFTPAQKLLAEKLARLEEEEERARAAEAHEAFLAWKRQKAEEKRHAQRETPAVGGGGSGGGGGEVVWEGRCPH
jgi:hypothetical protein